MAENIRDFSDTFTRLRVETVGTSLLCWAISAWTVDLKKVPILGFELGSPPPRGAIYLLALAFFFYCTFAFVLRFFNEARYSAEYWEAVSNLGHTLSDVKRQLDSVNDSLERFINEPPESSPVERIQPALRTLSSGMGEIKKIRHYLIALTSTVAFERVVIAFGAPLVVALALGLSSLLDGWRLLGDGLSYFAHPSAWQNSWASVWSGL